MNTDNLHYEIKINAAPDTVYDRMIADPTYREWTSVFNETSHFLGSWEKGSKILFVGCDADGNEGGMISRIKENVKGKFISIEHVGELKGKEEIITGPSVESWAGALENYTFEAVDGVTLLKIDMKGGVVAYADYFNTTWPKALEKLKEICER
ncbi:MAG: SRPBCC domain-containing protein [Saprospiraceae bacterium]|nr:SRPBCC domain-containing protein [Saprospiraceae bacterium]